MRYIFKELKGSLNKSITFYSFEQFLISMTIKNPNRNCHLSFPHLFLFIEAVLDSTGLGGSGAHILHTLGKHAQ